jgi:hypothetical protein
MTQTGGQAVPDGVPDGIRYVGYDPERRKIKRGKPQKNPGQHNDQYNESQYFYFVICHFRPPFSIKTPVNHRIKYLING